VAKAINPNCPICNKFAGKNGALIDGKPDARLAECTNCHTIWFRMNPSSPHWNQPGGREVSRLMQQHKVVRV